MHTWRRSALILASLGLLAALVANPAVLLAEEGPAVKKEELPDGNTIYIPYKDIKKVFDKEGGGVFLPYRTFLKLWRKSHPPTLEGRDRPALPAAVTAARYKGVVKDKAVVFHAEYQVEVFAKGWTSIPFAFKDLAISKVYPTDGRSVLAAGKKGYELVVSEPGTYQVKVDFVVKVREEAGRKSFSFRTPAASLSRFEVLLPGKSLKVDLKPNLAATTTETPDKTTRVFAFLGAASTIGLSWEPKVRRETAKKPLLYPTILSRVKVEEGLVECVTEVEYRIQQAPAGEFALAFPADYQIIKVEDPNIRDWTESKAGGKFKILRIFLHTPAKKSYRFTLHIEKITRDTLGDVAVPFVRAEGVVREQGTISIAVVPPLRAKVVKREGLSQIDLGEIPKKIRPRHTVFGFKYPRQPVDLVLHVEMMKPEVYATVFSVVNIQEQQVSFRGLVQVRVEKAGIFDLSWTMPKGYTLMSLGRSGLTGDSRVTPGDKTQTVHVQLARKRTDSFSIPFDFLLKRPKTEGAFEVPWIRLANVKNERGYTAVSVADGFSVTSDEKSMKGFTHAEDEVSRQSSVAHLLRGSRSVLGFKYLQHPLKAVLEVKKRRSLVLATVETLVDIKESGVKVAHTIVYTVKRAGVKEFVFTLPESVDAEKVEVKVPHWEQTRKEKVEGKEGAEGHTVFRVLLQKKVMDKVRLEVRHEMPLADLAVGQKTPLSVPPIRVLQVFKPFGYIAVLKGNNVVVTESETKLKNLDVKDPRDLPKPLSDRQPFLAYSYQTADYQLALDIIKYDYGAMVTTVIQAMHIDAYLTKERELNCYAILEIMTKQAQFLRLRLPPHARFVEDVLVAGTAVRPSKTERTQTANEYLIDLGKAKAGETMYFIRLHYTVSEPDRDSLGALSTGYEIVLPRIEAEEGAENVGAVPPPVNRVTLNLYVPESYQYLAFSTDMIRLTRPENVWHDIRSAILGSTHARLREKRALAQEVKNLKARAGVARKNEIAGMLLFSFYKTSAGGSVSVAYMSPGLYWFLDILLLVLAVSVVVLLPSMKIIDRTPAILGFVVGCLLLSALFESLTGFAATVFIGTMLAALFWVFYFGWFELRDVYRRMAPARPGGGAAPPPAPPTPSRPTTPTKPTQPPAPKAPEARGETKPRRRGKRGGQAVRKRETSPKTTGKTGPKKGGTNRA